MVRAPGVAFVRREQVEETVGAWLEAGARMVVVVNPRRQTVMVHRARRCIC